MNDMKGRTIVTPDPDSITAAMVRAMFRTESVPLSTAKEPSAAAVRVITTRYQDAVPFYLENGFAAGGRHRRERGGQGVDRQGRQGARPIACGADQAVHRRDQAAGRPAAEDPRNAAQPARHRRVAARRSDAIGYKGFVAPDPDVESRDHRLARPVAAAPSCAGRATRRPGANHCSRERLEDPEATRAARPRGPHRRGDAATHERQGGHGLRRPLRRRHPLRQGLQGGQQAQLPPGGAVPGGAQDQEQPAGARDGEGHALRPQGAGRGLAERRGRHACTVSPRRACACRARMRISRASC